MAPSSGLRKIHILKFCMCIPMAIHYIAMVRVGCNVFANPLIRVDGGLDQGGGGGRLRCRSQQNGEILG